MVRRRWRLDSPAASAGTLTGFPPLIERILLNRGIRSQADADRFLHSTIDHDPSLLPDLPTAIASLRDALNNGDLIAVFGDFDADGVTSTAILSDGLRQLGAHVTTYIPDRFTEGYGLGAGAIRTLAGRGARLLVTADCGTSNFDEIREARSLGMDVVVVDHHSPPAELPPATALINPKRSDNRYPYPHLSSGGIAYKLIQALAESLRRSAVADSCLDLAAISSICDMVPLRDENRSIVRRGLRQLQRCDRLGLIALCQEAGIDPARIDAETIGFGIGPRLNAAGRIEHGRLGLELLVTQDPVEARRLAVRLNDLNQVRQQQTRAAMDVAYGILAGQDPDDPLVMLGHPDIPAGIVGLVAGRLCEEFYKPTIVFEEGVTESRASCRSIPEFDIIAALRTCRELFIRYGGHPGAAGFTAATRDLPRIREYLLEHAQRQLQPLELAPILRIDAGLRLRSIRGAELQWLGKLGPHGMENPDPVIMSPDVTAVECRAVGDGGRHLRLKVKDGPVTWPAIAFGQEMGDLCAGDKIDIVYSFSKDRGGNEALQLQVLDFRRSRGLDGAAGGIAK